MVRFVAVIIVIVLLMFLAEVYTDFDVGVSRNLSWLAQHGVSGGYQIASNLTSAFVVAIFGE